MLMTKQIQKSQKIQTDYLPRGNGKESEKELLLIPTSTKALGWDIFTDELYQIFAR